jgi:translation initiation factor 2 gamma subunit (eIF-2gamma)
MVNRIDVVGNHQARENFAMMMIRITGSQCSGGPLIKISAAERPILFSDNSPSLALRSSLEL